MNFDDALVRFSHKVRARSQAAFINTGALTLASIQSGSPLTGAPGQPVDSGFLLNSWQMFFPSATEIFIATNCAYAPVIEYNLRSAYDPAGRTGRFGVAGGQIGPALPGGSTRRHKSTVGGNHSVALTRAGFQRLVDAANAMGAA